MSWSFNGSAWRFRHRPGCPSLAVFFGLERGNGCRCPGYNNGHPPETRYPDGVNRVEEPREPIVFGRQVPTAVDEAHRILEDPTPNQTSERETNTREEVTSALSLQGIIEFYSRMNMTVESPPDFNTVRPGIFTPTPDVEGNPSPSNIFPPIELSNIPNSGPMLIPDDNYSYLGESVSRIQCAECGSREIVAFCHASPLRIILMCSRCDSVFNFEVLQRFASSQDQKNRSELKKLPKRIVR